MAKKIVEEAKASSSLVTIDDMSEKFQELQDYSDSQFKTIIDLQKKITKLEEERNALKTLLENTPLAPIQGDMLKGGFDGISNEQVICETQIALLKQAALNRALTLEECRKFDIYVNIMKDIRANQHQEAKVQVSQLSEEALLELMEDGSGNG